MTDDKKYKIMQFVIEESNLELLKQESTIELEKLRAEASGESLDIEIGRLKFKLDLLHQRV